MLLKGSSLFLEFSFHAFQPNVILSFYNVLDVNSDGGVDKKELLIGLTVLAAGDIEKKLQRMKSFLLILFPKFSSNP